MSSTPTSTGRTAGRPGVAGPAAGWVAPLCWIAVLLDDFDLVVVGTVIPTLRTPEEWALSGSGATAVITIGLVGMMIGALTIGTLMTATVQISWDGDDVRRCGSLGGPGPH